MENLKLGWKSIRYAYGKKSSWIGGALIFLGGMACLVLGGTLKSIFMGSYCFMLLGTLMIQQIYTLNMSNIVLSSPRRKRMQTSVPMVMGCCIMCSLYLVEIVIQGIKLALYPEAGQSIRYGMFINAMFMVFIMLYVSVAYKHFFMSMVGFIFFYAIGSYFATEEQVMMPYWKLSYVQTVMMGLVIILMGSFVAYLLSCLVYKTPISKRMMGSLRREM